MCVCMCVCVCVCVCMCVCGCACTMTVYVRTGDDVCMYSCVSACVLQLTRSFTSWSPTGLQATSCGCCSPSSSFSSPLESARSSLSML